MDDDERKAPGGPPANRTIQIDALTDVQLIDHDADGSLPGRAPPPLPRKAPPRSMTRVVGLTVLALAGGALFALGVVHFLLPSAPVVAAPSAAPVPAPAPAAPPATPPASDVRHVHMDEELVIRSAEPTAEE